MKTYSLEEYQNCMKLLTIHKNNAKVSRLTNIPVTTVKNWKLENCKPRCIKNKIDPKKLDKINQIIYDCKSVREICKKLDLPYGIVLPYVKRYFPKTYTKKLKRKFHILSNSQKKMSPRLAYILGVMFGDGCVSSENYTVRLGVIDKDFRDMFAENIDVWAKKESYKAQYLNRGRVHYQCMLWSKDTGKFFDSIRKNRDVPSSIMDSDKNILKIMFIKGFVDSEGCVKRYWISVSNKNTKLLSSIRDMLIDLGFDKSHLRIIRSTKYGVYNLDISTKHNMKIYKEKIGFSIKRKEEKLGAIVGI